MNNATFRPAASSAIERASMPTVCGCCGREGLKRTVKMTDGSAVIWMGVGCAAKGTGVSVREINAAERAEQKNADDAGAQAREVARRAEHARWCAHLDALCPALRGDVFRQIEWLGGFKAARAGFAA